MANEISISFLYFIEELQIHLAISLTLIWENRAKTLSKLRRYFFTIHFLKYLEPYDVNGLCEGVSLKRLVQQQF